MNKRDAMNQIRQFGSKFDRLRNAAGGGGGGRNAPKRPKAAPNPASRKSNVFNEQVRYTARRAAGSKKHAAGDLPDGNGHRHFVDPAKRLLHGLQKRQQRGVPVLSSPQITVYLEKTLDDDAAARVVGQLQAEQGVDKVNYLSRDEALGSSVTGQALAAPRICWRRTRCRRSPSWCRSWISRAPRR